MTLLLFTPLHPVAMRRVEASFTLLKAYEAPDPDRYVDAVAPRVRAIATAGHAAFDDAMFARLPKLEIVALFGVGYDGVDVDAARKRGIVVTNTAGTLTEDVADLALALTIGTLRRLPAAERHIRSGAWQQGRFPLARAAAGRVAGILGLGRIGQAIARRLEAIGMSVRYHSRGTVANVPWPREPDVAALAAACSVLVVACPGGAATHNLVDARVLAALGPDGIVVNIARGSVIDEPALVAALEHGRIGGAGLDVFADEPNVPAALLARDDVMLTPHVGSATAETRAAMANLMVDNLVAHFAGKPALTPVT